MTSVFPLMSMRLAAPRSDLPACITLCLRVACLPCFLCEFLSRLRDADVGSEANSAAEDAMVAVSTSVTTRSTRLDMMSALRTHKTWVGRQMGVW